MDQRLAVEISPLPQHEGAKREQAAERGQRLLQIVIAHRAVEAEIEAGYDKQYRHGRGELEQDRYAADKRRHAQCKMVGQTHHHADIGKQGLEIAAGDVAEILEQDRAAADLLFTPLGAPECLAGIGRRRAVRLGRNHHHHIVVDLDFERTLAQTKPGRNIDGLLVVPAAEHADIAIVLDRRLDLHAHQGVLAKGARDLVMRDFDEVGLRQYTDELFVQAEIGRLAIGGGAARFRIDLRVEVKIGLAQPVKFFEILMMKNGAQQAGKLPKSCLLDVVKAALGDEPADNIRLPQRNETIPRLWRDRLAMRFIHEAVANAMRTMPASILQTSYGADW